MEAVKVSVIVTVYNIENYIQRAVDSILASTHKNLEIFLVDDGSSDASPAICDAYAKKDERVYVIHKPNTGVSDARNAGLRLATGDYIGFVDGDDWVEPDMFQSMVQACVENNADMAVCRYNDYRDGKVYLGNLNEPTGRVIPLSREDAFDIYLCGHEKYVIYHSVWSKLIKREIAQKFEFPKGKYSEDILYTTWTMCEADKIVILDTPYYNYISDRSNSIMNTKVYTRRKEHEIPNWREQILYLRQKGMDEQADKAAYYFYRRLLFYYMEYLDFRAQGQEEPDEASTLTLKAQMKLLKKKSKSYAKELAKQMQADKKTIYRLLKLPFAKAGDVYRMKLFLLWPRLYGGVTHIYERVIIPIRRKLS